jgi:hypothetical protein
MHRQIVVRVHAPVAKASVVTSQALVFAVTARTEPRVVGRNRRVRVNEARTMLGGAEPSWRDEHPLGEARAHPAARLGQVAGRATRRGIAARRVGLVVTAQAPTHTGQVRLGSGRRTLHGSVTLRAADVPHRMGSVVEPKTRRRANGSLHTIAIARLEPEMTVGAHALPRRPGLDLVHVAVIRLMTAIAHGQLDTDSIRCVAAGLRGRVARHACDAVGVVPCVIEKQRNGGRREDDLARAIVIGKGPWHEW